MSIRPAVDFPTYVILFIVHLQIPGCTKLGCMWGAVFILVSKAVAALEDVGYWAFLVPLVMLPVMFVRFVARGERFMSGGRGVSSEIKKALGVSLVRTESSLLPTRRPRCGNPTLTRVLFLVLVPSRSQRAGLPALLERTVAQLLVYHETNLSPMMTLPDFHLSITTWFRFVGRRLTVRSVLGPRRTS